MDVEKTIAETEWLERIFALPDDDAAGRIHDEGAGA